MSRSELAPFMYELAETVGTALFRLEQLRDAATKWLSHDAASELLATVDRPDSFDHDLYVEELQGSQNQQLVMFEALEAFLAAWARVSLLLFPTHGSQSRGAALTAALDIKDPHVLAILDSRDLRDSWMHFDERLDAAVAAGTWGNRHRWVRCVNAPNAIKNTLRVFEVDTLVVHVRARSGGVIATSLQDCEGALKAIASNWKAAWQRL